MPACFASVDGLVEVLERGVGVAESEQAERDVAVVLAHRRRGLQLLADRERLLVVAQRLAEVSEQQVHAADVAERVADAARKVDARDRARARWAYCFSEMS